MYVGFSIVESVSFLLKFTFLFSKKHGLFQRSSSCQNQSNIKAIHAFAPRSLIFKLQQEVLKVNDASVSWSLLKTELETNFLYLENISFGNVSFSQ